MGVAMHGTSKQQAYASWQAAVNCNVADDMAIMATAHEHLCFCVVNIRRLGGVEATAAAARYNLYSKA
jgi:hypothetical protein